MVLSEEPYFFNSASAADKHEANSLAVSKLTCGIEQRVERVAGTVIPRVHHDELVRESVHGTKLLSRIGIKRDLVVMGPGRYCEDLHRIYSSRQDTFLHETIKDHYVSRGNESGGQDHRNRSKLQRRLPHAHPVLETQPDPSSADRTKPRQGKTLD